MLLKQHTSPPQFGPDQWNMEPNSLSVIDWRSQEGRWSHPSNQVSL